MKKPVLIITLLLLLFGGMASAQTANNNYQVTHDSTGFKLIQDGQAIPFDTAFVAATLKTKAEEETAIQTEISLLEQLLNRRRQLAAVVEEKKTLQDIIKQARQCVTK